MDEQLVDRIYECSFVPELWPPLLQELANIASARLGNLFVSKGEIHNYKSSSELAVQLLGPLVKSGWVAKCERFRRLSTCNSAFLSDSEIYTADEMANDPFYRDILYPRGLGWAAGTTVQLPTGDRFSISVEREYQRGPVEPAVLALLNELRPHIARSALMTARLQFERASASTDALALLRLPALVFDESGRVLAANHLIESLAGYVLWKARDRVSLKDRGADALFQSALAAIDNEANPGVRSFPARQPEEDAAMIAHVVPIRLSARDIFVRCAGVLLLTPLTSSETPPVELVQSLFDLTPAEARVARNLAIGKTIDDIASDTGISRETVRTHLRHVLEKTGCTRQADVVGLLTRISSTTPAPKGG